MAEKLTCDLCDKRLTRKTARQLGKLVVCSDCLFGRPPRKPIAKGERQ